VSFLLRGIEIGSENDDLLITIANSEMDSLTHLALGAVLGEALAGKKIGKKAMLFGALAQSVPDIDFVASFWLPITDNLLAHRGFTHSLLFGITISLLFAFITRRWQSHYTISLVHWFVFFGLQIGVHLFLDSLNAYGVGLFEPFSHIRISFDTIFVADPFFSIWPGLASIALLLLQRTNSMRKYWITVTLVLCSSYLVYGFYTKYYTIRKLEENLNRQHISFTRYFTTPSPLNVWLWYIVVQDSSGYYVGYRSVFDSKEHYNLRHVAQNKSLLKSFEGQKDLQNLIRFSQGFYTADQWHGDTLVFNDLRFGQIVGWHNSQERFAFHYFLQYPEDNALVVQRGRFAKWNKETTRSLLRRIAGE
jgi:inner membrane protein